MKRALFPERHRYLQCSRGLDSQVKLQLIIGRDQDRENKIAMFQWPFMKRQRITGDKRVDQPAIPDRIQFDVVE